MGNLGTTLALTKGVLLIPFYKKPNSQAARVVCPISHFDVAYARAAGLGFVIGSECTRLAPP